MVFHENGLLADDSHEISYLSFFVKLLKMLQNLSPAAVVIGNLRVRLDLSKSSTGRFHFNNSSLFFSGSSGSVVECLNRGREAAGSSLTGVTALCP